MLGEMGFSVWSSWDTCTQTCGGGTLSRSRTCDDPGNGCDGNTTDVRDCNTQECPGNDLIYPHNETNS